MKTRIIQTKFWADDYVSSLPTEGKLLFLYYLTNDKVNIIHCYECSDKYVIADTGINQKDLSLYKGKFQKDHKILFYKGYVKLLNANKYETYTGKNDFAKARLLTEMAADVLDWYNNIFDTPLYGGMDGPSKGPINHKSETINHKSETTGVVKGPKKEKLENEDFQQIADDYHVPLSFVLSKWEDLENWCKAKGKTYKDYKAALRNWVKKDALSIRKEANGKSKITIIAPDPSWEHS